MLELISKLLSSLVPVLFTAFFAWIGSRNDQAKRKQMFEDAKQRIELINTYVASQKLVIDDAAELGAVKKTAANELYNIKAFLDKNLHSLEKSSEKSESYWQRFFLLYKMRTGLAGFLRVCFFLMLLGSVLYSIFLSSMVTPASLQNYGLGWIIVAVITWSLPGVLVGLLLRWLAVKFDKPTNSLRKVELRQ
jgi:hypothetical protein